MSRHCSSIFGLSSLSPINWLAVLQAAIHPSQDDPGHCHPSPLSSNPCAALQPLHTASATCMHCREVRTKGTAGLQQQHIAALCCPWKEAVALSATAPSPAGLYTRCWPARLIHSTLKDERRGACPFLSLPAPQGPFCPNPHFALPFDLSDSLVYLL